MICTRALLLITNKHLAAVIVIINKLNTHIMRPIGVIKVETFYRVLGIRTLGVCNAWNSSAQFGYFRNLRGLTGGGSVHLNDTLRISVHFPTIEGSDSYSHLHTRHLEEEIYFRNIIGKILKQVKTDLFLEMIRVLQWFYE